MKNLLKIIVTLLLMISANNLFASMPDDISTTDTANTSITTTEATSEAIPVTTSENLIDNNDYGYNTILNNEDVTFKMMEGAPIILGLFLFLFIICLIFIIFSWFMMYHAATNQIKFQKLWIILMLLLPVTSIIYFFVVKIKFKKVETPVAPVTPVVE